MNGKYKQLIKYGKIQDNYLVDFPQHVLTEQNNAYFIEINDNIGFKFKLSTIPSNYTFCLPLAYVDPSTYQYEFFIDWGDGSTNKIKSFDDKNKVHIYKESGTYIVTIIGKCFGFNNKACFDKYQTNYWEYLTDIISWGSTDLFSLNYRIL